MHPLLILGAGGFGRSVAEVVGLQERFRVVGFLDDGLPAGSDVNGVPVLGPLSSLGSRRACAPAVALGIGNNATRARISQQAVEAGFELTTVVHPWTSIAPSALLGPGCVIMAGVVIGTAARLGRGVIVNAGAVMDHDTVVEEFGHLGVRACMAGGSRLGLRAWLQCGASLGVGVKMPQDAVLLPGEGRSCWNE